jgi:hypothetical protein
MDEAAGPADTIRRVVAALDAAGIAYYIGGSVASSLHGTFRQTAAVDFVAKLLPHHPQELALRLEGAFYLDVESVREAVATGGSFNLIDLDSMEKCDIFVSTATPWAVEQMRTRVRRELPGSAGPIWIASAASTVLQKLLWYQLGGGVSDRQWRDVLGVLATQGAALDRDYLRRWAEVIGVSGELERALAAAPDHG